MGNNKPVYLAKARERKTQQLIQHVAPQYAAPFSLIGSHINRIERDSLSMAEEVNLLFAARKERRLRGDQRAQIRAIIGRLSDMQADLSIVLAEQEGAFALAAE